MGCRDIMYGCRDIMYGCRDIMTMTMTMNLFLSQHSNNYNVYTATINDIYIQNTEIVIINVMMQ